MWRANAALGTTLAQLVGPAYAKVRGFLNTYYDYATIYNS